MGELNVNKYGHIHYQLNRGEGCKQKKMVGRYLRGRDEKEGLSLERKGRHQPNLCLHTVWFWSLEGTGNLQALLGKRNGYLTGPSRFPFPIFP